jgi:hypothetical protein
MRIGFKALLAVTLCLFLQACSGSVEFVLLNESDTAIEVEYVADMKSYMPPGSAEVPEAFIPKTMSYGKWESSHTHEDWTPLTDADYNVDISRGKFRLTVPPRTALRLSRVDDSIFFRDSYKDFQLKKLEMRGIYGNVSFEGTQLFREFTRNGRQTCTVTYRK